MRRDYFNRLEFKRALLIADEDLMESKQRFINYIEKYPQDYTTYTYFAVLLITMRDLDGALKVLNEVDALARADANFNRQREHVVKYRENYNFSMIKLLCYQNKYAEILNKYVDPAYNADTLSNDDLCELNENFTFGRFGLRGVKYYCLKKMNRLIVPREKATSYLFRQIIDYQENDFWDHIKRHMLDDTNDNTSDCIFNLDFPVEAVVNEIKKMIPNEKAIYNGFLEDVYTFKYDECGKVKNRSANYFQAVVFHDSSDFITMYPTIQGERLPHIDLSYMNSVNDSPKIRRRSQIDRFNQRFGNK